MKLISPGKNMASSIGSVLGLLETSRLKSILSFVFALLAPVKFKCLIALSTRQIIIRRIYKENQLRQSTQIEIHPAWIVLSIYHLLINWVQGAGCWELAVKYRRIHRSFFFFFLSFEKCY